MSNRKSKGKKALSIIILIILLIVVGGFASYKVISSPASANATEVEISVEAGATLDQVAAELEEKGLVKKALFFKVYSKLFDSPEEIKAGPHVVRANMHSSEIMAALKKSGEVSKNSVTIPEGYTLDQIATKLEDAGIVSRDELYDEVRNGDFDYSFIEKQKMDSTRLDGFLFPATYNFTKGMSAHEILDTMLRTFENKTEEIFKKFNNTNQSYNYIITVASIVEKEAQKDDERAKVASVIYNRLDANMPLQMCSSIQYILGEPKEILTEDDIAISSPYNTYENIGLPPGPICNPGIASIEAALKPEKTKYMYFVLSEKLDGSQRFSVDYDEFLKNKDAYYDALKKAGRN